MITDENKTEIIDSYLEGSLDAADRQEVEERMRQDAAFRREVELQHALTQQIQLRGELQLKKRLGALHEQHLGTGQRTEEEQRTNVRSLWSRRAYWAVAASLALLLVVGSVLWLNRATWFSGGTSSGRQPIAFQVPVLEKGDSELGFGGETAVTDSVVVQLLQEAQYNNHYRFRDTLQLFLSQPLAQPSGIKLNFDRQTSTYHLELNGNTYRLEKGFNQVRPLAAQ
jgi:hypothetical protein